ncbi:PspC domain-containing protein [Sphingobacterium psychroaquaticum]|uniref:PspC domain-containing protein n=1 Tax=Sphingobacterium psychroaquaticum TaxID=561061 RepID=UPI00106C03A2|nr:PspC domain-containing protein [Sphingobacterium psychroaquaticum]QBQ42832.1 PspC domain-containing protein [Sphingobacterium psychroaquaticum]
MNKTIIININSIVFHIEEDAYETLRAYMIDIKKHFGNTTESKEILEDIENRIAEMFNERIQSGRKEVINLEDVQQVILQMGQVSDFEDRGEAADDFQYERSRDENPSDHFGKKLMRDPDDKIMGGVCSGLAHYFGMEPRWVRILLVLFVLIGGSGFLIYVILWIVMPEAETRADKMAMRGKEPNLQNFKESFDEEVKSFSDNFAGAGEQISRGARSAGSAMGGCLGFIGKMIAWLLLINTALSVLGLFIFYVFNLMNLFGLENPMFFPPLRVLAVDDALIAITLGFLAIVIPLFAFALLLIRILFKTEKLNNYLSLSLFAAWVVSIVGVIYYCVYASQDFREKSTISIQKSISEQDVYHFTEKDVRVLDANEKDSIRSKFNIQMDGEDLRNFLNGNIDISFESIDSLSKPYIQYNYSAKGKSYQLASERARNIVYEAIQEKGTVLFPSHFLLKKNALDRDQYVRVVVFLPVGAKVAIHKEMEWKLRGISYGDCLINYADPDHQKITDWKMTKAGLVCLELPKEEDDKREEVEEEAKESAEVITKKDSVIKIDGGNVTIEVKDNNVKINKKST